MHSVEYVSQEIVGSLNDSSIILTIYVIFQNFIITLWFKFRKAIMMLVTSYPKLFCYYRLLPISCHKHATSSDFPYTMYVGSIIHSRVLRFAYKYLHVFYVTTTRSRQRSNCVRLCKQQHLRWLINYLLK